MILPTWLVELITKIDQSDEFVCKHIDDYLNGRIDNLGVARLFDLVGCLIDEVEDTQSLLNKALDRVAQSSVELATANQQLKCTETEIEQLREENQLLKLERDELVRHEERMHADIGAILGSDTSLVDAAAMAVAEIERLRAENERLTELNKEAEEQLCAIAKEFCGDARNCEQHPKTLAGFVVQEVGKVRAEIERLRALLEGYEAMEKTMKREVSEKEELEQQKSEIARLRRLLEPAYTDTDLRESGSKPTTINDYLVLLSSYIADYMPSEAVPNDEYFGAWETAARPLLQRVFDEIASLNRQLDAAAVLLRRPERVTWGYDSDRRVLGYFLDGNYAGDTLRDVILAAATTGV